MEKSNGHIFTLCSSVDWASFVIPVGIYFRDTSYLLFIIMTFTF